MAKINLLPWREELRKKKRRVFLIALGASASVAVLSWVWHTVTSIT